MNHSRKNRTAEKIQCFSFRLSVSSIATPDYKHFAACFNFTGREMLYVILRTLHLQFFKKPEL